MQYNYLPKRKKTNFIKVGEIRGEKQNGTQEDKYQQRTSHKKQNKNIEQQHRPLQKTGELRCSERLAVPASCATPVMLFIVNDMYIEYSGFHTNDFSQEDTHICFTHYNFAQYFQDIIYWTHPIKTSSFCGKINLLAASLFLSKKQDIFWMWP